tara:strand:- start:2766 stop:3056 length:291 start_codon:yes stop_codon:yes gene_type:complete
MIDNSKVKDDFIKISNSGYFNDRFCFTFQYGYIILTTDMYWDYVVQHNIDSVEGLNFKYKIVEMVYEYDAEEDEKDNELWDVDGRSYREWKVIQLD